MLAARTSISLTLEPAERTLLNGGLGGDGITGIDQQPEARGKRPQFKQQFHPALRSVTMKLMPVAFLLGRLRPAVAASVPAENTIGMVAVAAYPQKSLS